MSKLSKALIAAAGNSGGAGLMVEDVFSTYLYKGTGSSLPIVNGIDLADSGGLVWTKRRTSANSNWFLDSERGGTQIIRSNTAEGQFTSAGLEITSFNSDGYTLGTAVDINSTSQDDVSWTFRKAEKFFDVVTYTGNGVAGREIAHNLGSVPACIIIKETTISGQNWVVYHSGVGATDWLALNNSDASTDDDRYFQDTEPTDSVFTVGNINAVNGTLPSTREYVAYLFASDAGGFGDDGSESIIKCGSFVPSGGNAVIDVGFEPQWLLVKAAGTTSNWVLQDSMRGWPYDGNSKYLRPNLSNAEDDLGQYSLRNNGFIAAGQADVQYIYIAIRRPMKTPESGTEVFATAFDAGGTSPTYVSGFVADMGIQTNTTGYNKRVSSRLTSGKYLEADNTGAEQTSASNYTWDFMNGWNNQTINSTWLSWMFKRATGFFDVVAYTGTGVAGRTVNHNLGVAPELMIFKNRSQNGDNWVVYSDVFSPANYLKLNDDSYAVPDSANLRFNNTAPTDSVFTVGTSIETNFNGQTYISYHFATLAGVSKVGSYTGTGADLNVDCGFSAGARFVLIKRSDSGGTGNWYVYDSVRGIVAGNDPYLLLNSSAAEVTNTDYIDPLSSGFTVTSSAPAALNASGGNYIFLAIS